MGWTKYTGKPYISEASRQQESWEEEEVMKAANQILRYRDIKVNPEK